MVRPSSSQYLAYATILLLTGSVLSISLSPTTVLASHSDIEFEIEDIVYGEDDDVTIDGTVDGGDENDEVTITVEDAGGSEDSEDVELDEDGNFDFTYTVPNNPDEGIYRVSVEFDSEEVFGFFIVDEEDDNIEIDMDSSFDPGDDVTIEGSVMDEILDSGVDEVEITVVGPDGSNVVNSADADVESDGAFEYDDLTLDDEEDIHGLYAVIISYDDIEEGWAIFEVSEDGGSSNEDPVTVSLSKSSYQRGDEVVITGVIEDPDPTVEVFVTVLDPEDDEIFEDNMDPDNNGEYEFEFELSSSAQLGEYTVTVEYNNDEAEEQFTVTGSSGSGGGGSGSGSSSGLTARLSKSSPLAGEAITVTGVVPRINSDELVNIVVLRPNGAFAGVSIFPEPASDKTYSGTLRLPSTLEEDEDYTVVVGYDNKEVRINFDITGKATGSTGAITVKTDKTSYTLDSTVVISGQIADDIFVEGQQVALQVYNPDRAAYRFDPITPEDDGSYSYSMKIGGPLGVSGEWDIKVTYGGQSSETTFDLTGGQPSSPTFNLVFEDRTFPIKYLSDGTINSMFLRPAEKKLVVSIDADADGQLTITLPREVIDSVQAGSDVKYIVTTVNTATGEETQIDITESVTNSAERTIVIDYDEGTGLIEIQGTNVVPEFGVLSAVILAIAIFSIIALTTKFSNRFNAFRQW